MECVCVQLKVCEGCGRLYLRDTAGRAGVADKGRGVYCHRCERRLSAFPAAGKRVRPKWRPRPLRSAVCAGGAR
jgi:hypothetical protein